MKRDRSVLFWWARIIPTKDLKQILPQFNNVLKACVACHLEFNVHTGS